MWRTNQMIYSIYLLCLPHQRCWEGFQKVLQLIRHSSFRIVNTTVHFHYYLFLTVPSPEFWQEIYFVDDCSCPSLISFWFIAGTWNICSHTSTSWFGMFHKGLIIFLSTTHVFLGINDLATLKALLFRSSSTPGWFSSTCNM